MILGYEIKESDYSFNQSVIDALKEGKSVWSRCNCGDCGTWNATNRDTKILLAQVFEDSWALEKPKTKVKKWQWIYKKQGLTFDITCIKYSIKEAENENLKDGCYRLTEPYLPSETKVEE